MVVHKAEKINVMRISNLLLKRWFLGCAWWIWKDTDVFVKAEVCRWMNHLFKAFCVKFLKFSGNLDYGLELGQVNYDFIWIEVDKRVVDHEKNCVSRSYNQKLSGQLQISMKWFLQEPYLTKLSSQTDYLNPHAIFFRGLIFNLEDYQFILLKQKLLTVK